MFLKVSSRIPIFPLILGVEREVFMAFVFKG